MQVPPHISMAISVKIRGKELPEDRDYLFEPKAFADLGLDGEFLAHVTSATMVAVQVRNTSNDVFAVPKHFRVGTLTDYAEEGCYVASPNDAHLAVKSSPKSD